MNPAGSFGLWALSGGTVERIASAARANAPAGGLTDRRPASISRASHPAGVSGFTFRSYSAPTLSARGPRGG
jgi:hypothetical protein